MTPKLSNYVYKSLVSQLFNTPRGISARSHQFLRATAQFLWHSNGWRIVLDVRNLWPGLFVACFAFAGCSPQRFGSKSPNATSALRYAINNNPTTLDPGLVQDIDTSDLILHVYEGLVSYNEHNALEPQLAENWTIENGGRTYVFHLRKGVKFHDGHPLTARDVKWSWERNLDRGLKSATARNYLAPIVGVAECAAGKTPTISGVVVLNDRTLTVTTDKPRPYFLGLLTYPTAFVLEKGVAPAHGPITEVRQAVGTGPFKLESFIPEQIVTLTAFSDYYLGAPKIARIERPVIKDAATRLNKFRNGELDFEGLGRQDILAAEKDPALKAQLHYLDRPAVNYLGLNPETYAPFKDVRVRRAFAMAIDKTDIVNTVLGGNNRVANGLLPPGIPGYREHPAALAFDPAAARALLAQAGFRGPDMPPLTLIIRAQTPDAELVAETVQDQLKSNLGVAIKVQQMEWQTLLDKRNKRQLQMTFLSWYADYLDAQNFLSLLLASTAPLNTWGYANPEFDRLCAAADMSFDEPLRERLYASAEDIMLQDAPWIPLFFVRDGELVSPRVHGMRTSLFGHLPHLTTTLSN